MVRETGLEPACPKRTLEPESSASANSAIPAYEVGGQGWIRTIEVTDGRFTVCSLWPLGNLPTIIARSLQAQMELAKGLEPATC